MAKGNARGARYDIKATASGDISKSIQIKSDGSVYDLTDAAAVVVVKDENGNTRNTVNQTISDAANGWINFLIPKEQLTKKEGEELTYEFNTIENGETLTRMHGYIYVLEML